MAIIRVADTDDDGGGLTGTVRNNAWKSLLYDQIDAAFVSESCFGRLTLTTAVPVTTADVTGATTIYWTPYRGKHVALYSGTAWTVLAFAETSLALGTVTSGLPYDIFAYNNSGTLALEKLAWTNGTTRATALVLQDGVLVKTGATTRRYLGTIYTTSTTATEDSAAKRFVWNYYNRVRRQLYQTNSSNWNYTTATIRQANASATMQVEVVVGVAEALLDLSLGVYALNNTGGAALYGVVGIGEDSVTAFNATVMGGGTQTLVTAGQYYFLGLARLVKYPAIGRHYYAHLEYCTAIGTTTWYDFEPILAVERNGLNGWIEG